MAQAGLLPDPGAEPRRGAAHRGDHPIGVLAAQRHDEGRGVVQVGADIDGGDGDRGAAQIGSRMLAALDQLGDDVAQLLAHA